MCCFLRSYFQIALIPVFQFHHQINTSHQDENLHQQTNTVSLETKGRAESPGKVNGVAESAFVVEVDKSLGSLGLTLEGGSDMGSDVKIKSVKVSLNDLSPTPTSFQWFLSFPKKREPENEVEPHTCEQQK